MRKFTEGMKNLLISLLAVMCFNSVPYCHVIVLLLWWIFEQPQMTEVNGSTERDRSCLVGLRDGYELSSATLSNSSVPKQPVQDTVQDRVEGEGATE